jgi:hypothetical protein
MFHKVGEILVNKQLFASQGLCFMELIGHVQHTETVFWKKSHYLKKSD